MRALLQMFMQKLISRVHVLIYLMAGGKFVFTVNTSLPINQELFNFCPFPTKIFLYMTDKCALAKLCTLANL